MEHDRTPAATIPDFTPVPRKCDRSNGWKPEVQRAFIEALAETGSVKAACRRVGRADHGVYQLRRHPDAGEFRRAWQAALDLGIQRIEDVAMDRAINGTEEPVYSYGKLVGTRIKYNDRLLMFMLRNRAPERFGEGGAHGLSAVDRMRMKRLKEEWRKEWTREEMARMRNPEVVKESILRKFEAMDIEERKRWTPREHELREALDEERKKRRAREEEEARQRYLRGNPPAHQSEELESGQEETEETTGTPPLLPGPDGSAPGEEKAPESRAEPETPPAPPPAGPRIYSMNDFPVRRY